MVSRGEGDGGEDGVMGEAKRKRDAGEPVWRWKDPLQDPPPRDAHNLAVLVSITCPCAKGGQVALCAGRQDGEWVIAPFEHNFEIDYWLKLPEYPRPRRAVQ